MKHIIKNISKNRLYMALIAAIAFILINIAATNIKGFRLDLTEDKLFTLSNGTVNILKNIKTPIEVNFYYSDILGKEMPAYNIFATHVRDMLDEFKNIAGDNFIINQYNPKVFSIIEDNAVKDGMQGVPLENAGDKVYFGIAGKNNSSSKSIDDYDLGMVNIPFFQLERERFLELDLAKLIYRLANPDILKVGIITGAEVFGSYQSIAQGIEPTPWAAIKQIQQIFIADQIYSPKKLHEYKPDILLLIHPADLSDEMTYAIDQYILGGGKAIFFVDPLFETAQNPIQGMMPIDTLSDMNILFNAWGVNIAKDKLVGDKDLAAIVNGGNAKDILPMPYILWLQATKNNFSNDDIATASIENLMIPTAGHIIINDDSKLTIEPLIISSKNSMAIDIEKAKNPDIKQLLKDFKAADKNMILAARLSGNVISAFPNGKPISDKPTSDDAKDDKKDQHISASIMPINIIIVADADMLTNRFWVRIQNFFGKDIAVPVADNGNFLINALDSMAGSSDLISLRSRGTGQRKFTKIAALEKTAEDKFRVTEQALNQKMLATEQQIEAMQNDGNGELSLEQKAAIDNFTKQLLDTRKELRQVNHSLRQDVDKMEANIKFINIILMPLLVALLAIIIGYSRIRRRRRNNG